MEQKVMQKFLENTHRKLKIYLKQKNPKTSEKMVGFVKRWSYM